MKWLSLLLLLSAAPVAAQIIPPSSLGDPRFQTLEFAEDIVYPLSVEPGYQMAVIFAASEEVQSIAVGDSASWQITPSGRGDTLFVRASAGAQSTNMTVITDARTYVFELMAGGMSSAWVVRFSYNSGENLPSLPQETQPRQKHTYRLSGSDILYPNGMEDDGFKTYITWPEKANMPAIFAKNDAGKEQVVDGQIREGIFVVDQVYRELIFRLDKRKATAKRNKQR